jgi:hypothetical protein
MAMVMHMQATPGLAEEERLSTTTREEIRAALLKAVANVEGVDVDEIEDAVDGLGGDEQYELDSKTAEAVLAEVGETLGFTPVGPADLDPDRYATLVALLDLVEGAFNLTGRA